MRKMIHIVLLLLLVSCGQTNEAKTQFVLLETFNHQLMSVENSPYYHLLQAIEKEVKSFEEIFDVVIIKGKEHILIAYKVHHLKRFRMKKIEKDLMKKLEENFPDEQFAVSSDYKIFLEVTRLQKKLKDPNFTLEEAEKRLKKIIKLKNELT